MAEEVSADPKYGLLDEWIVNALRNYERDYFLEDKPVPFCGLTVYPIQVRDFDTFSYCTSCLTLNKNEDPSGVRMSHLDYLLSRTQIEKDQEGSSWSFKIQRLFELIFRIENGLKCQHCGKVVRYDSDVFRAFLEQVRQAASGELPEGSPDPAIVCPECGETQFSEMIKIIQDPATKKYSLCIDGHTIDKKDFNLLRQLVLYQNFADYVDDTWVDPEVKKDHDEKIKLEQQRNNVHASLEKKVVSLSISTHYSIDQIFDMPIRKFTMALSTVDDFVNYKITKQAVLSGFVSLPKGQTVEHWIYKPDKDMYGDSYKSTDQVQESVSNL